MGVSQKLQARSNMPCVLFGVRAQFLWDTNTLPETSSEFAPEKWMGWILFHAKNHLERIDGSTRMYWFIISPYKSPKKIGGGVAPSTFGEVFPLEVLHQVESHHPWFPGHIETKKHGKAGNVEKWKVREDFSGLL